MEAYERIHIRGIVEPEVLCQPNRLTLSAPSASTEKLSLRHRDGLPFKILSASCDNASVTAIIRDLDNSVVIEYCPDSPPDIHRSYKVSIETNAAGTPALTIPIRFE